MSANYVRGTLKSSGNTIVLKNGATYTTTLTTASSPSGSSKTITFPDATDTVVLVDAAQTLTNKTLTAPSLSGAVTLTGATTISGAALTVLDSEFTLQDQSVSTKKVNFQLSGITGSHTWSFPDASDTIVGRTMVQTIQNKTLDSCSISANTNGTLTADNYTFTANGDATTAIKFATTGITVGATRIYKFPDVTGDTLVSLAATQTLTNKTLTAPTLTTPALGAATATSINKVAITAPATAATLTIADGKTLTASASITLAGTDGSSLSLAANLTTSGANALTLTTTGATSVTLPTTGTLATLGGTETFSGVKSFSAAPKLLTQTAVQFYDADGSHYRGLKAHATTTTSGDWTLPPADGTTGQVLKTDGSNALGWVSALTNPATTGMVVDGTADENQLRVQGHSTQTSDILVVEKSDGTDLLQTTNANGTHIRGTTTNDAAAAGFVGETKTISLDRASANALTTAITENLNGSVTLGAGEWDISAMVGFLPGATTSVTGTDVAISVTTGTLPALSTLCVPNSSGEVWVETYQAASVPAFDMTRVIPSYRVSLASSTTLYLVVRAAFTVSTMSAYGYLQARRMR